MKYFGTDGIRGLPNETISVDLLSRIGMALIALNCKNVILATDTRQSKDMLAYTLAGAAMSRGLNIYFGGIAPTPLVINYSKQKQMVGVVITASHNPYQDNGIKIFNKGLKLSFDEEEKIEYFIEHPKYYLGEIGSFFFIEKALQQNYIKLIKQHIIYNPIKVAIDCANGATYKLVYKIFSKVTPNLYLTGIKPNGKNINENCGSTHLEQLKKVVLVNHCDIGFSFDGDGDRILCVSNSGQTISGDEIIYLFAKYLKKQNKLNNNKVVLSIMSNLGIVKALQKINIDVIETPVGDKYIQKLLKENNFSLGGENSGHIIVSDLETSGDGLLNALFIMQILAEDSEALSKILQEIKLYSDIMVNVRVENKLKILQNGQIERLICQAKEELKGDCKIIVRPSGTEDVIRITVMAREEQTAKAYANMLALEIQKGEKLR